MIPNGWSNIVSEVEERSTKVKNVQSLLEAKTTKILGWLYWYRPRAHIMPHPVEVSEDSSALLTTDCRHPMSVALSLFARGCSSC